MATSRRELSKYLKDVFRPWEFKDYGPNGLQIEGSSEVQKIAFAVSATKHSIEEAVRRGADTLIVHHGLFWKFHGTRALTGPFAKRVFPLVRNHMNLFGFHLPLDAHPEIGNAATIAKAIGMEELQPFCEYEGANIGIKGTLFEEISAKDLKERLESVLNHSVMMASPEPHTVIKKIGIVTGGASDRWQDASRAQLDAYITGEMSEHHWHESQEAGIAMFAGGHNATESLGIQKLMEYVNERFEVETFFIPSANPA